MAEIDPHKQREFAAKVVRQLRESGFQAYWAGGCVRDFLLNRPAKDFDVATDAAPEDICRVFSRRKTLAVGAAFGVMTVLGSRGAGQVEVATFRQDGGYSDGRRPDHVTFSSPEEDAKRRDFTINGMFFDPLENRVIDFVGGQADLQAGIIRAIGNPEARFTEDKLRLLRAVRFASILNFQLDSATATAIGKMAPQITVVSAERIADEMRRMLVAAGRVRAVMLLHSTGLLTAILPEGEEIAVAEKWPKDISLPQIDSSAVSIKDTLPPTLTLLQAIETPTFPLALAALLHKATGERIDETVDRRWRLARAEINRLSWLLSNQDSLSGAAEKKWSQIQPLLIHDGAQDLVNFQAAKAAIVDRSSRDVEFCRNWLARPLAELDPLPLVDGGDLHALHIHAGPIYSKLLQAARDAQLDGIVSTREESLALVQRLWQKQSQ